MTLVLTIPSNEGTILASDGETTLGSVKTHSKKIFKLNDKILCGAAGDVPLIQKAQDKLANLTDKTKNLKELRNKLCDTVSKCLTKLPPPQPPSDPYSAHFMFVEFIKSSRILFVYESGISVMLEDVPFAIGSGRPFAFALFQKYESLIPSNISNELASLLAYKIIAETIDVVSGGIGPPIDVWQLSKTEAKNLTKEEISALNDTCIGLQNSEIELFLRGGEIKNSKSPS